MPTAEQVLRDVLSSLDSSKITERKKAIDDLTRLLQDEEMLQYLNRHSKHSTVDWDQVFYSAHKLALNVALKIQAEEFKKENASETTMRNWSNFKTSCSGLVTLVTNKANLVSGVPKLKGKELVSSVMQVLEDAYLLECYGNNCYLPILNEHLLTFKKYWPEISAKQWNDVMEKIWKLFSTSDVQVNKQLVTDILIKIVTHGSMQSHIVLKLRSRFHELTKAFSSEEYKGSCSLLQLSLVICQQVAKESRTAACRFGEDVIMAIIHMYEYRIEEKKKLMFDFFLLQMQLHHPLGAKQGDPESYACNWGKWNKLCNSMYTLVETEIRNLQKVRFNTKDFCLQESFLQFAIAVCKQVSENEDNVMEVTQLSVLNETNADPSGPKRRRIQVGIMALKEIIETSNEPYIILPCLNRNIQHNFNISSMTTSEHYSALMKLRQPAYHKLSSWEKVYLPLHLLKVFNIFSISNSVLFSLLVLSKLISTYPGLVKYTEFPSLLTLAAELQSNCKDSYVMNHLCKYASSLLEVESHIDARLVDDVTMLWDRVLNVTLRNIGLNQSEESSHELLQSLIRRKKVDSFTSIVRVYLSGEVKLSQHSLKTLDLVLQNYILPDTVTFFLKKESSRKLLLNWLLPDREDILPSNIKTNSVLPPTLVGKILIRVILKSLLIDCETEKNIKLQDDSKWIYSVEEIYRFNSFQQNLFAEILPSLSRASEEKNTNDVSKHALRLDTEAMNELITLFKRDRATLIHSCESLKEGENEKKLEFVLSLFPQAAIMFSALSYLVEYNVVPLETLDNHSLTFTAQDLMMRIDALSNEFLREQEIEVPVAYRIVTGLESLFSLKLHKKVEASLKSCVSDELEKKICSLLPPRGIIYTPHEDEENFSSSISFFDRSKLRLQVTRTLCSYFFSQECMSDRQKLWFLKVLQMMQAEFRLSEDCDFEMAEMMLKSALRLIHLHIDVINNILTLLQAMCRANRCNQYGAAPSVIALLTDIVHHVASSESASAKQNCIILVKGCYVNVDRRKYGPQLYSRMIKCIAEFAKIDPSCSWSNWVNTPGSVPEEILVHISSPFHEVRMMCARYIGHLFLLPPNNNNTLAHQKFMIERLTKEVASVFLVEADLRGDEVIDESSNRIVSVLHILASIILVSPYWRRKALFSILQLIQEKNISKDLVKQALRHVTALLHLEYSSQLLTVHLRYCLSHWLNSNYPLENFPFELLNCTTKAEFYNTYKDVIVPLVIHKEASDLNVAVGPICQELSIEPTNLITDCFPFVLAPLLPYLAVEGSHLEFNISDDELRQAKRIQSSLQRLLGMDEMNDLLASNLAELVVEIIQLVFDPEDFLSLYELSKSLPEPGLRTFKIKVLLKVLNYFQQICQPDTPFIVLLAKEVPQKIQYILLTLLYSVHKFPTEELKLQSFHHYAMFVDVLAVVLESENGLDQMTNFVVHDVCHSLVNLITGTSLAALALAASRLLERFCQKCLKLRRRTTQSEAISNCLGSIVSSLVPQAKNDTAVGSHIMNILTFLVVDCADIFKSSIKCLDPFPKVAQFETLSQVHHELKYADGTLSLEEEIVHFLDGKKKNRLEGLQCLQKQISERKWELRHMYDELKNLRGFSEDCTRSVLHRLIYTLIGLVNTSDAQTSLEASRCLGELGPCDLTTIILKPGNIEITKDPKLKNRKPVLQLTGQLIVELAECLFDSDIEVVRTATKTLYHIFETKEGIIALNTQADFSKTAINKTILTPFITSDNPKSLTYSVTEEDVCEELDHIYLWSPGEYISHYSWLTRLICKILNCLKAQSSFLNDITDICKNKPSITETILPLLIHLLITEGNAACRAIVSRNVRNFFRHNFDLQKQLQERNSSSVFLKSCMEQICLNKSSIKCMLNVIHYIHLQSYKENDEVCDLDLDYLHVAKAALFCDAYFSSIFYAELWCLKTIGDQYEMNDSQTVLDYIYWEKSNGDENSDAVQSILRETYTKLGLIDAVAGCGFSHLLNPLTRVHSLEINEQWAHAVQFYDLQYTEDNSSTYEGMTRALYNFGTHNLLRTFSQSVSDSKLQNIQYDCYWRLNKWDVNVLSDEPNYEKQHYAALKSIYESDFLVANKAISMSRQSVLELLRTVSLESSKSVYPALSQLRILQELEDFSNYLMSDNNKDLKVLIDQLQDYDKIRYNKFDYIEPILLQRVTLLNMAQEKNVKTRPFVSRALSECLLQTAALAREEGWLHVSQKCLHYLKKTPNLEPLINLHLSMEEAQVAWAMGNQDIAIFLLKSVIGCFEERESDDLEARVSWSKALKLYGIWMTETKSENPQVIVSQYIRKAEDLICDIKNNPNAQRNRLETYSCLARFADTQYEMLDNYMKSSEFEMKQKEADEAYEKSRQLNSGDTTQDIRRTLCLLKKQCDIDKNEIRSTEEEREKYLILAMKYYMKCLKETDTNNLFLFRVVSLWLDNSSHENLLTLMDNSLPSIPSYKFLLLLTQLAARISSNTADKYVAQINSVFERCAVEHPHHTLPILLSIANLYLDQTYNENINKAVLAEKMKEPRLLGAQMILKNVRKSVVSILKPMEDVQKALVSLAYWKADSKVTSIPKSEPIRKIKDFTTVLVPTVDLPVNKNGQYVNIVGISGFESVFSFCGGVNRPKRITCTGSDGIKRPMLVKGMDDLRQDAVMQQVFTILNMILQNNAETCKKKLLVRTYKNYIKIVSYAEVDDAKLIKSVVPLSQRSGVLEWCQDTQPVVEYLAANRTGACYRYYPQDMTIAECKNKFFSVAKASTDEKLRMFNEICHKTHPVFHYFFLENFKTPGVWFERRLAYIHSVATTSMIGYILGLGDRHFQNILIDKKTAEFIHIDFGIAFEQGRTLPTPETVPFRLTRNVVFGMGVCGIEGTFRKSCEKTMSVLRQNKETITTILEVLLYDPLYLWTITPSQAYKKQHSRKATLNEEHDQASSGEVNKLAKRALTRLKQKLLGTEDGTPNSVAGQVNRLLQEARDPMNLCKLYVGWQPYL